MNRGSLIAIVCTWSWSALRMNSPASTSPAVSEGVIRQARMPSRAAFAPNSRALTQREAFSGSIPRSPKNARTEGNAGGKWVTGWLEASQASR